MSGLKIPATIRVLDVPYSVRVIDRTQSLFRGADHGAMGSTDLDRHEIVVRGPEDQSTASAIDTVLHEVFHAILAVTDRGEDHEAFICRFVPVLLHTLRSNPQLVAALQYPYEEDDDGHAHGLRPGADSLGVRPEEGVPHEGHGAAGGRVQVGDGRGEAGGV